MYVVEYSRKINLLNCFIGKFYMTIFFWGFCWRFLKEYENIIKGLIAQNTAKQFCIYLNRDVKVVTLPSNVLAMSFTNCFLKELIPVRKKFIVFGRTFIRFLFDLNRNSFPDNLSVSYILCL